MASKILINTFNLNHYMFQAFSDGTLPSELFRQKINAMPFKGEVIELHPSHQELTLGFPRCQVPSNDLQGFWQAVESLVTADDECLILQGDSPLLDIPILEEMMLLHHKYIAEYTFADAWPKGLAGEILKGTVIPALSKMALGDLSNPDSDSLFKIIGKDINQFDLETMVAPRDYRPWRLELLNQTKEGWLLIDKILSLGFEDSSDLSGIIDSHEDQLRILPAYFQIQLNEQCPQECSYCPYPETNPGLLSKGREFPISDLQNLLEEIHGFNPQARVSFSLWGEPSLYGSIYEALGIAGKFPSLELIIETSGIGWDLEKLKPLLNKDQQCWIVSLDATNPALYETLRGRGQREVFSFIDHLEEILEEKLYCQVVRMEDNESDLEQSFLQFKHRKASLIIQKYDFFCGEIPQKKVSDLSPVKRHVCWHNKRELVIMVDGTVARCREDLKAQWPLGNVLKQSLPEIWNRGQALYLEQLKNEFKDICRDCDEYYTYNF